MIRERAAGRLKKIRLAVSLLVVMLGILTLTVVLLTDYVPMEAWSRSSSTEERIKILNVPEIRLMFHSSEQLAREVFLSPLNNQFEYYPDTEGYTPEKYCEECEEVSTAYRMLIRRKNGAKAMVNLLKEEVKTIKYYKQNIRIRASATLILFQDKVRDSLSPEDTEFLNGCIE